MSLRVSTGKYRGDPRREEIADELSALSWRLDHQLILN
jgi:hypothetical protein